MGITPQKKGITIGFDYQFEGEHSQFYKKLGMLPSTPLFKVIAIISVISYLIVGRLKQKATARNVDELLELQKYRHISASLEQKGITKQIQPTPKSGAADL